MPIHTQSDQLFPLPVAVGPYDDEYGLSYVMRTLYANGLSLDRARVWLGIKSWFALNRQEISLVAWHLGVSPDWLRWRLLTAENSRSITSFGLLGCKFVATSLRQPSTAALCPECVRRNGFSRPSWVLKCVVVCSEHGCPILEDCVKCGRPISWLRPSIDICNCGRYLISASGIQEASEQLLCWVRWIEWRLGTYNGPEGARFTKLIPQVLNEMSLDGAMRLVISFGILHRPMQSVGATTWKKFNNLDASEVVERGLLRLRQIDSSLESLGDIGSLVHLPILERMRSDGVEEIDVLNSLQLVTALKKKPYGTWDRRVKLAHGQRSLFW